VDILSTFGNICSIFIVTLVIRNVAIIINVFLVIKLANVVYEVTLAHRANLRFINERLELITPFAILTHIVV
jgi:hypothetical protein